MAQREFTDRSGRAWRVWEIGEESELPEVRASTDYSPSVRTGWLLFESRDGLERRRLHAIPSEWIDAGVAELERLRDAAEVVPVPGGGGGGGAARGAASGATPPSGVSAVRRTTPRPRPPAEVLRSFLYPGGRLWTVSEQIAQPVAADGSPLPARTVLRFTAGVRSLDLLAWPDEWATYDEGGLADLLWRSFPRDPARQLPTAHRRRRGDLSAGDEPSDPSAS